jgi:hypothetical protein
VIGDVITGSAIEPSAPVVSGVLAEYVHAPSEIVPPPLALAEVMAA